MFITRSEFETTCGDINLVNAVKRSSQFLPTFEDFYRRGWRNCTEFVVVVGERHKDVLMPIGILVTAIEGNSITGRRFENELNMELGELVTITQDQVLDCRFTRSLQLEGGWLYRAVWNETKPTAKAMIAESSGFFLEIPKNCQADDFALIRKVEELQSIESVLELCQKPENDPLKDRNLPEYKSNRKTESRSLVEYLIMLGYEGKAWALLQEREVGSDDLSFLILIAIKYSRNQILKNLIRRFGDVSSLHFGTGNCLNRAVDSDNLEAAEIFIELGFDLNKKNTFKETPFAISKSLAMAKLLLSKGADARTPVCEGNLTSAEFLYSRSSRRDKELADFARTFCSPEFLKEWDEAVELDEDDFVPENDGPNSLEDKETFRFIISALNTSFGAVLPICEIPLKK